MFGYLILIKNQSKILDPYEYWLKVYFGILFKLHKNQSINQKYS